MTQKTNPLTKKIKPKVTDNKRLFQFRAGEELVGEMDAVWDKTLKRSENVIKFVRAGVKTLKETRQGNVL